MAVLQEDRARPFGKQTQFFEDMVKYYETPQVKLLFFSPYTWNHDTAVLEGLIYQDGTWQPSTTQKPTLVYDRSFSRNPDEKLWLSDFRDSLNDQGVTLFNPVSIQELSTNKETCAQWQESRGFSVLKTSPLSDLLEGKLENVRQLYLKPRSGSRGIGVLKLHRIQDQYRLYANEGSFQNFPSLESLADHLSSTLIATDYIVQEEANLYAFRDAPFDLRLVVQNVGGEFLITGEAVRIGQPGAIVSNLSSGGAAISLAEFQSEMGNTEKQQIATELDQARKDCLAFTNALQQEFGNFAELGFDVLLTCDKGPIILEVNAKPSRWVFVQIADHEAEKGNSSAPFLDMRKRTVINPVRYAERILLG